VNLQLVHDLNAFLARHDAVEDPVTLYVAASELVFVALVALVFVAGGLRGARAAVAALAAAASATTARKAETIKIGLITKTETNPFFVKMREGAQAQAKEYGAQLMTAAGKFDSDNASQVAAIENMVSAGVKGRRRATRACSSSRSTRRPTRKPRPTPSSPRTTSRPAS
jgi:hypothetical protein